MKEIIKERLKIAWNNSNIKTQKQLSKITGISTASLSRYFAGQILPQIDDGLKLAKALNISISWLAGEPQ